MAERTEKKTEPHTVRLPYSLDGFACARARQKRFESVPEYIRYLIEQDKQKAADDYKLLCEALGIKETLEINDSIRQKSPEA